MMDIRIGIGEDVHRLVEGKKLVLGGIAIPFEKGLLAHSDGDVAIHALSDALLGSLALGDIGHFFPADDPKWENGDSREILREVTAMVKKKGYEIANVDLLILAEKPKLASYLPAMRAALAETLGVDPSKVGIQAGTEEGLGEIGRGEGIRAKAAVLVRKEGE